MNDFLLELAILVPIVWAATEGIAKAFVGKVTKEQVALALGPIASIAAHSAGWIDAGAGVMGYVGAAVFGFLATMGAGVAHDKVIKPFIGQS